MKETPGVSDGCTTIFVDVGVESHDTVVSGNALADVVTARRAPALRGTLLDPTAMRAFAHPSVFAVRSTGVARRFPSPPPRASRARLAVAARASSEGPSRPETSREARRDVHAPRTYTREDSVDGDESYSLLDAKGFGPPETETVGATSTWGARGTSSRRRRRRAPPRSRRWRASRESSSTGGWRSAGGSGRTWWWRTPSSTSS